MRLTCLRLLALCAWVIALLLYMQGAEAPGCGADVGCGQVLSSQWSHLFRIPVSLLAMLTHAGILVLSLFIRHQAVRLLLQTLVLTVALTGLWFIALQAYEGAWCPWCCAAHACAILMVPLVLMLKVRPEAQPVSRWASRAIKPIALASLLTAFFITAQFVQPTPPPAPRHFAGFTDLRLEDNPLIGNADAPYLVAVLYDPVCPHCRVTHQHLRDAMRSNTLKKDFAIALLPVALSDRCNPHMSRTPPGFEGSCELVKLQLGLWIADPAYTDRFDAFLFDDAERAPSLTQAGELAEQLVGSDTLADAMQSPQLKHTLRRNTDVFNLLGRGVPRLIIAGKAYPAPPTIEQMLTLLDAMLTEDAHTAKLRGVDLHPATTRP
jgi:uncharacterized membrane protein